MPAPSICTVSGVIYGPGAAPLENVVIKAYVTTGFTDLDGNYIPSGVLAQTVSDVLGEWSLDVIQTETLARSVTFQFEYPLGNNQSKSVKYAAVIPDTATADFADLVDISTGSSILNTAPTTDALPEGVVNLYFTVARAQAAISGTAPISVAGGVVSHNNSTVTPGSYTLANITIDAKGHITAASNGSGGGTVTSVTASAPLSSSGGATPDISITQSDTSTDGYLSSTDWNTFNDKQDAGLSWLLAGNASTSPGSDYIGTSDAQDLIIKTNNQTRLTFDADGGWNSGQISVPVDNTTDTPYFVQINANPSGNNTSSFIRGFSSNTVWDQPNAGHSNTGGVSGLVARAEHNGSGTLGFLSIIDSSAYFGANAGTTTLYKGINFDVGVDNGATITDYYGISNTVNFGTATLGNVQLTNISNSTNDTTINSLTGLNVNPSIATDTTVATNVLGAGIYPSVSSNGNITGSLTGVQSSPSAQGTSVISGDIIGSDITPYTEDSASMNNFIGQRISMGMSDTSAVTTSVEGLQINISSDAVQPSAKGISVSLSGIDVTPGVVKYGIDVQDGAIQVNSNFTIPGSNTYLQTNYIGGADVVAAGDPTATFGFGINLAKTVDFQDDWTADPSSLGYNGVGFVGAISGAAGKTMYSWTGALGGAGNPSGDGTLTNATMFKAAGILPQGGSLAVTNMYGFQVDPNLFGLIGTNTWGIHNASSSDNYLSKLAIGTINQKAASGLVVDVVGNTKFDGINTFKAVSDTLGEHVILESNSGASKLYLNHRDNGDTFAYTDSGIVQWSYSVATRSFAVGQGGAEYHIHSDYSDPDTTPATPSRYSSIGITNADTTDGNYSFLAFQGSQGGVNPDSAIFGIHDDHNGASSSGSLELWTRNAGTFARGARIAPDKTVTLDKYTAGAAIFDASGVISSVAPGTSGNVLTSNGTTWVSSPGGGGSGDVVGPASAVNNNVVFFDGTTGKLIKDSGLALSGSNTGDQTITLTGDVTGSGTGSFAATLTNSSVTSQPITGFVSGAGVVAATDTILEAIEKLDGNIAAIIPGTGDVVGPASSVDSEVVLFDGTTGKLVKRASATGVAKLSSGVLSASNVDLTSEVTGTLPNSNTTATDANTASAIVSRDASGNFTAGTITAALTGTASGNEVPLTFSTGLTRSVNTVTVNTTQNITKLSNLTSNGFVKTSSGDGTLSVQVAPLPVADVTIAPQAIASTTIDWSAGNVYTKTLSANTTFTFSNQTGGQTIIVRLTNTASNYTVTWPTIKWAGGIAPVMTIGAKDDIYTFIYDGTTTYGSAVQDMS